MHNIYTYYIHPELGIWDYLFCSGNEAPKGAREYQRRIHTIAWLSLLLPRFRVSSVLCDQGRLLDSSSMTSYPRTEGIHTRLNFIQSLS